MIRITAAVRRLPLEIFGALMLAYTLSGCAGKSGPPPSPTELTASAHNKKGIQAAAKGDLHRAEEEFATALSLNTSIEDRNGMVLNLLNMTRLALRRNDPDTARTHIDRAKALAPSDSPLLSDIHKDSARTFLASGDVTRAESEARKAIEAARPDVIPGHLNLLAAIRLRQGKQEEAESTVRQALQESRRREAYEEEADALHLLGDIQAAGGFYGSASGFYRQALDIHKRLGLSSKIAADLLELARVSILAADIERGIDFARRSLEVARAGKNVAGAAAALDLLADISSRKGDRDGASRWQEQRVRLLQTVP